MKVQVETARFSALGAIERVSRACVISRLHEWESELDSRMTFLERRESHQK